MKTFLTGVALIGLMAIPSISFAGTNQTYEEYAKEKCAKAGLLPSECLLTRPDDPTEGQEPPMHEWPEPEDDQPLEWPEGVPVALAEYERPVFRYECMEQGWLCSNHVGVYGRGQDEDRNDGSEGGAGGGGQAASNAPSGGAASGGAGGRGAGGDRPDNDRSDPPSRGNPCRN